MKYFVAICIIINLLVSLNSCQRETSFPIESRGRIYLPLVINDSLKANLMFDTGSYDLILDSTFYLKTGNNFSEMPLTTISGTGNEKDNIYFAPYRVKLKMPDTTFTFIGTYVYNHKSIFGKKIDGIIGIKFFENKIVDINYGKNIFTVNDRVDQVYLDSSMEMKLNYIDGLPCINAQLNISKTLCIKGNFMVDLGFDGYAYLTSKAVKTYQVDTIQKKKTHLKISRTGFGRSASGFFMRGNSINIGNTTLTEPLIICSKNTGGELSTGGFDGLLGNSFFKKFNVCIDFKHQKLYLKKRSDTYRKSPFFHMGMSFIDRTDICDGYVVTIIHEGSETEKAGIQFGDIVTHLNKIPMTSISPEKLNEILKTPDKIKVSLRRGKNKFEVDLRRIED